MSFFLSEFSLNLLGSFEELAGREGGFHENDTIEKLILRLKAPGLCFNERGLPKHRPYSLTNERYGFPDMLRLIAQIGS